jgi:ribonucleoside-diphosphate reductase alpha chain
MEVFNAATHTILAGGRRGANMGVLSIYHPDIYEYLNSKSFENNTLEHFNLSFMVDDKFMNAVKNNENINLHYPVYDLKGKIIEDPNQWKIKKEVNAASLWDLIIKKAYDSGEYGVMFYDNMNKDNNTYYCETIVATNPCGEFLSGIVFYEDIIFPYMGACNLGSLFLHNFVECPFTTMVHINWVKLKESISTAVRFLDNIIDINKYPNKNYEDYQKMLRTIGLGITGLATVFSMFEFRYGDDNSIKLADELMDFITINAYNASVDLAIEKDTFPMFNAGKFIESNFLKKHAKSSLDWEYLINRISRHGIRNARLISIAPTGTLSLSFGNNCSSGIEPIMSLEQKRKIKFGGQDEENIEIKTLMDYGYALFKLLDCYRKNEDDIFPTIMNLSVDEHLNILKTVGFHTDMNISKTLNLPESYSFKDTKDIYTKVHELGIKSCTIFRPNSIRQGIFVIEEPKKVSEQLQNELEIDEFYLSWGTTIQSSDDLIGRKCKIMTGCGSLHVQAWFDPIDGNLLELFLSKGSEGGCNSFMIALSRIISAGLRTGLNFDYAIDQLKSVPACNSYTNRTIAKHDTSPGNSCPRAIANVLIQMQNKIMDELGYEDEEDEDEIEKVEVVIDNEKILLCNYLNTHEQTYLNVNGEIAFAKLYNKCPECGEKLNNTEGCLSCICGWSKCG